MIKYAVGSVCLAVAIVVTNLISFQLGVHDVKSHAKVPLDGEVFKGLYYGECFEAYVGDKVSATACATDDRDDFSLRRLHPEFFTER